MIYWDLLEPCEVAMRRLCSGLTIVLLSVAALSGNACVERTPPATGGPSRASQPTGTPAPNTCPQPAPDRVCTKEYQPVLCKGCRYANACVAASAGFRADDCLTEDPAKSEKKCPDPAPGIICTMEYAPVLCDGCKYPNGCVAGAAGYKKEQCVPDPAE
jgi:hypothetical protein